MARARLSRFLVNLCKDDQKLTDFQVASKRRTMLDEAKLGMTPDKKRKVADVFFERKDDKTMFDLIKTQQAGTGHARVKDANRLATKARKGIRKKR